MKEDEKNKYITLDENYYWNHTCVFNIIFYVKKKKKKKAHIFNYTQLVRNCKIFADPTRFAYSISR